MTPMILPDTLGANAAVLRLLLTTLGEQMEERVASRLRELRSRRGLTQEELAEVSGLSPSTVKKVERGETVRMETLHTIAKALGAETVWFVVPPDRAPDPADDRAKRRDRALAEMRSVLLPPMFPGKSVKALGDEPLDGQRLRSAAHALTNAYHEGEYDKVAQLGPSLLSSALLHSRELGTKDTHQVRADALGTVGRWLCQVHAYDLALVALREGLDAASSGDDASMAAQITSGQAWIMIRQARFREVEDFCASVAEEIEPRMSKASKAELASWGMLLLRSSSAAARNNRQKEAREYLALAQSAAAALGIELPGHESFGPVGVSIQAVENELVAGHPDRALSLANRITSEDLEKVNRAKGHRHLLDRAQALIRTGSPDEGAAIIHGLRRKDPQWLRHQGHARRVVSELPNAGELADFFSLQG